MRCRGICAMSRAAGSARRADDAPVTIYLACTVRGDRSAIAPLKILASSLERAGHTIVTKHLLDGNVDGAESAFTERAVYERDIAWLDACDLLIADASGSSFGVGF